MPGEQYDSVAAKAPQSYVSADTRYLPVDSAAGMGLAERDNVPGLYPVRILDSRVGHSSERASGGG